MLEYIHVKYGYRYGGHIAYQVIIIESIMFAAGLLMLKSCGQLQGAEKGKGACEIVDKRDDKEQSLYYAFENGFEIYPDLLVKDLSDDREEKSEQHFNNGEQYKQNEVFSHLFSLRDN